MKLRSVICILMLTCTLALRAQSDTLRLAFSVQGTVTDGETGKAIESALVSIPGTAIATATNADGRFNIKSGEEFSRVQVSYLGYKTVTREATPGASIKIRMTHEPFSIEGARIISGNPYAIVRAAIEKIPENYSSRPELMECFYRETIRKKSRYTYISEAVARMYKSEYTAAGGTWKDRTALEKSRVLLSQRRSDTLSVKVQGGPAQATYLDVVKNRSILFNEEELSLYIFEMELPTYIDGRLQFVISFHPGPDPSERALYYGTLYIDSEKLYFTRIEMSLDMSDTGKAIRQIVVRKPLSLRLIPKEMSIVENYSFNNGVARMSYFRSTFVFNCDWKKRLFATSYTAINELVVTDLRTPAEPIAKADEFRTSDILSDKAAEFMDPDFWTDYNIIEPSESLEHAVNRLRKGH